MIRRYSENTEFCQITDVPAFLSGTSAQAWLPRERLTADKLN
jgi:hypothetical protein